MVRNNESSIYPGFVIPRAFVRYLTFSSFYRELPYIRGSFYQDSTLVQVQNNKKILKQ